MKIKHRSIFVLILLLAACSRSIAPAATIPVAPSATSPATATPSPVSPGIGVTCEQVSNPHPKPAGEAGENPYIPHADVYQICTFSGQVSRGKTYKQQVTQELVFCLLPGSVSNDVPNEGWKIVISDTRLGSCDVESEDFANFGPIVTPPFYGNLFFDVYGWHFRNEDNTGENDGNVNAPQEERGLHFLLDREDYEAALHILRCQRWAIEADCALATQNSQDAGYPVSLARFTIQELELGNLVPGSHAWIENMLFQVEMYLPAE